MMEVRRGRGRPLLASVFGAQQGGGAAVNQTVEKQ